MNEEVVFRVGFALVGVLGLVILVRARTLAEAVHALQLGALASFSFEQALGMLRVLGGAMVFMGVIAAVELIVSTL